MNFRFFLCFSIPRGHLEIWLKFLEYLSKTFIWVGAPIWDTEKVKIEKVFFWPTLSTWSYNYLHDLLPVLLTDAFSFIHVWKENAPFSRTGNWQYLFINYPLQRRIRMYVTAYRSVNTVNIEIFQWSILTLQSDIFTFHVATFPFQLNMFPFQWDMFPFQWDIFDSYA